MRRIPHNCVSSSLAALGRHIRLVCLDLVLRLLLSPLWGPQELTGASSDTKPIADTRVRSWSVVAWVLLAKLKIWTTPQACLRPPPCSAKFSANIFLKLFIAT